MKRAVIIISILVSLLSAAYLYTYLMDHTNLESFPDEVMVFEYDLTKAFLFPLDEGYLLFDTGYAKSFSSFKEQLSAYHVDIEDIRFVVLSHHHDDHAGFVNELAALNPEVQVIVHEKSVPLLTLGQNNVANRGGIVNHAVNAIFNFKRAITPDWDFTFQPYFVRSEDVTFNTNVYDLKPLSGLDAKLVYTPGHTSDSISLVYKDRFAFVADLASNILNWLGSRHLTLFNENVSNVYTNWELLLEDGIEVIIPSHGKPFNARQLKDNLNAYEQADLIPYLEH